MGEFEQLLSCISGIGTRGSRSLLDYELGVVLFPFGHVRFNDLIVVYTYPLISRTTSPMSSRIPYPFQPLRHAPAVWILTLSSSLPDGRP
jgi:hypothetical protein